MAVIGGGPAGAAAAAELAGAGVSTVLYHCDPAHGEKPCGGGVTLKGLDAFPFLKDLSMDHNPIYKITLFAPSGRRLAVESDEPFFNIYNRGELDSALRARAAALGAEIRDVSVQSVRRTAQKITVVTENGSEEYDTIVGADGAFSRVRRALAGDAPKHYFCPAVDELIEGVDPASGVTLAFYKDVTGYLWVFPRRKLASVGLVAREGELPGSKMRERVAQFIKSTIPTARSVRSVGWTIPAPGARGELPVAVAGEGYLLCGDAAGLADPITGEGIYYAILSGALAARAIASGNPAGYPEMLQNAVGAELACSGRWAAKYFRPRYVESVLLAARFSSKVRRVLADLLSGRQKYSQLDARIRRELGVVGWLLRKV